MANGNSHHLCMKDLKKFIKNMNNGVQNVTIRDSDSGEIYEDVKITRNGNIDCRVKLRRKGLFLQNYAETIYVVNLANNGICIQHGEKSTKSGAEFTGTDLRNMNFLYKTGNGHVSHIPGVNYTSFCKKFDFTHKIGKAARDALKEIR